MAAADHLDPRRRFVTWRSAGAAMLALVGFGILAALVDGHAGPFGIDRQLSNILDASKGSAPFGLAQVVSAFGAGPVVGLIAVVVGVVVWGRTHRLLLVAAVPLAAGAGGLLELATKQLVARPRPPTAVIGGASGFGFPSGHTTGFTALVVATVGVMVILDVRRRTLVLASVLALGSSLAVATSRVVLGVHWATDVVGGLFLGTADAIIVVVIVAAAASVAWTANDGPDRVSEECTTGFSDAKRGPVHRRHVRRG